MIMSTVFRQVCTPLQKGAIYYWLRQGKTVDGIALITSYRPEVLKCRIEALRGTKTWEDQYREFRNESKERGIPPRELGIELFGPINTHQEVPDRTTPQRRVKRAGIKGAGVQSLGRSRVPNRAPKPSVNTSGSKRKHSSKGDGSIISSLRNHKEYHEAP